MQTAWLLQLQQLLLLMQKESKLSMQIITGDILGDEPELIILWQLAQIAVITFAYL